jgi:hypothetical protein
MSDISIKITAGLNGKTIEIIADENSTIKELKKLYANKYKIEFPNIEGVITEHDFKFVLGSEIPDDNRKLNEVLTGDVLKGEVPINAVRRSREITNCLRDINKLDSIYNPGEKLVEIEAILIKMIGAERVEVPITANKRPPRIANGKPILASSDKDIVLAAVGQDGYALEYASKELKKKQRCCFSSG